MALGQDKNQAQDKTDEKRLWVLRAPGELVEYDPATFVEKAKLRVSAEAFTSPQKFSVNRVGQMMFADPLSCRSQRAISPRRARRGSGTDGRQRV